MLSKRVSHLVENAVPCQYTAAEIKCKKYPYSTSRLDGYIDVSIAENKIMFDMLQEKIATVPVTPSDLVYSEYWHGKQDFRELVSKFLNKHLGYDSNAESVCANI